MGLDMYLRLNISLYRPYDEETLEAQAFDKLHATVSGMPPTPKGVQPSNLRATYEVGYWRKANAIHRWFVENVQHGTDDCGDYAVDDEDLDLLEDACLLALDTLPRTAEEGLDTDHDEDPLPTQAGCFFGSTDKDEWYYDDIHHTLNVIRNARIMLELVESIEGRYSYLIYHSSW